MDYIEHINRKSGRLYRRYMTQHILDAAGMRRSAYNLEELPKMGNVSAPYAYNRARGTHEKQGLAGTGHL
ncbi:MAG: hypothetical protein ACOX35_02095 [Bacillota bacterium]|jgi:CubicO group peptidase (beta-lactamase class C family)|nr:hypothetical protein [Candidatus Fermentithermobacillaceae bacterium]